MQCIQLYCCTMANKKPYYAPYLCIYHNFISAQNLHAFGPLHCQIRRRIWLAWLATTSLACSVLLAAKKSEKMCMCLSLLDMCTFYTRCLWCLQVVFGIMCQNRKEKILPHKAYNQKQHEPANLGNRNTTGSIYSLDLDLECTNTILLDCILVYVRDREIFQPKNSTQ